MDFNLQRYIDRQITPELRHSLRSFPVTALLGPRQCGKSTLARHVVSGLENTVYLDLEKPSDHRKLEDPEFFFHTHRDPLVCIDEIQMGPDLFPVMRVAVDEDRRPGKFLILGSASQDLIRNSSETLAGRIHFIELTPFHYNELLQNASRDLFDENLHWIRGGFPDSMLAPSEKVSSQWRQDFIRTFLERDIPQFGFSIPAVTMRRFWTMLAHHHGQTLNASKLGQSLGVSHPTISKYLDIMAQTFMVRILPPLSTNIKKRLIKSPKVYIRDSGILHALLDLQYLEDLLGHPNAGVSWEGWCIEQILAVMLDWRASFYRTASGEEIDLILEKGTHRIAIECKASMAPRPSRGFQGSLDALQPERVFVVAPVPEPYRLKLGAEVTPIKDLLKTLTDEISF
jgi:predicted AAA+ superfamily ATPase